MRGSRLVLVALVVVLVGTLAPTGSAAIKITKIRYNPPGVDTPITNSKLNGEWVRLKNTGNRARALGGWRIRDTAGHVHVFPAGYRLGAGRAVKLHTGSGQNSARHHYYQSAAYIWNNDRDRATLKNAAGRTVDRCSYNNSSASSKTC